VTNWADISDQLRHIVSFGQEMCVLTFVNASWVLINPNCATTLPAVALCNVSFMVVGTLLNRDLNIRFIICSEPGTTFGVTELVKKVAEAFGSFELSTRGVQEVLLPLRSDYSSSK
jgi:hypothetical protein